MSAGSKQLMQYGDPFPLLTSFERGIKSSYSKAVQVKNKLARKYGIKFWTVGKKWIMNLKYQFDIFTRRIFAGVSSTMVVWMNSIIVS